MRCRLLCLSLLVVVLVSSSCSDRDPESPALPSPVTTTTVPGPTPRALLQPVGVASFPNCTPFSTCTFAATLVNNGSGCGYQVKGTVRLLDKDGLQLGAPYPFSLPFAQVVQVSERVQYFASFVPFEQALRMYSYLTDVQWVDTNCR